MKQIQISPGLYGILTYVIRSQPKDKHVVFEIRSLSPKISKKSGDCPAFSGAAFEENGFLQLLCEIFLSDLLHICGTNL